MEKQRSQGSIQMEKIRDLHNAFMKSKRETNMKRLHVQKLIAAFPKNERPLYQDQIEKYESKLSV